MGAGIAFTKYSVTSSFCPYCADSTDYVDWAATERARLPNLKPSTRAISLRLPVGLLKRIKVTANKARRALPVADQNVARREGGTLLTLGTLPNEAAPFVLSQLVVIRELGSGN